MVCNWLWAIGPSTTRGSGGTGRREAKDNRDAVGESGARCEATRRRMAGVGRGSFDPAAGRRMRQLGPTGVIRVADGSSPLYGSSKLHAAPLSVTNMRPPAAATAEANRASSLVTRGCVVSASSRPVARSNTNR